MNFLKIATSLLITLAFFYSTDAAKNTSAAKPTSPATEAPTPQTGKSSLDSDFVVYPNPARDPKDNIVLVYLTRCIGTAVVTIYDAVGSPVYEAATKITAPNAVGHKIAIPWDCHNKSGRAVGNGTYLAVIQMFDIGNRLVERHTAYIGVAF